MEARGLNRLFRPPRSGNRFVRVRLDVEDLRPRLTDLSITPFLAAACGRALRACPELRSRVVFGALRPRDSVVVSVVVALGEGQNLGVVRIEDADRKDVSAIAREIAAGSQRLRAGADPEFERSMSAIALTPTPLLGPTLGATGWLTGALGVGSRGLGLQSEPLGSLCLSNIGGMGLDEAFSPPTPFAHAPVDVVAGALERRPVARNGAVSVRLCISLGLTVDARIAGWPELNRFVLALQQGLEGESPNSPRKKICPGEVPVAGIVAPDL